MSELPTSGEVQMRRRRMFQLLAGMAISGANLLFARPSSAQQQCLTDYTAWVGNALQRMQTIAPGMTRKALLTVFTTEGGLSTGLRRTFVSRDCPYFKVDVEFQAVGRPDQDADGRVTGAEDSKDLILKISTPYLQFSIMD